MYIKVEHKKLDSLWRLFFPWLVAFFLLHWILFNLNPWHHSHQYSHREKEKERKRKGIQLLIINKHSQLNFNSLKLVIMIFLFFFLQSNMNSASFGIKIEKYFSSFWKSKSLDKKENKDFLKSVLHRFFF